MRVDFILKSNIPLEIRESQEKCSYCSCPDESGLKGSKAYAFLLRELNGTINGARPEFNTGIKRIWKKR